MKRREFITLLGRAAAAWPLAIMRLDRSFRGSWMGFAYCDFTRRMNVARADEVIE